MLREDVKDLEEKHDAEKMSVDALEATLVSLNDDHTRLQKDSIKIISTLQYGIVVKNKSLKEKEEIINQKQGEITKLAASINYYT